MKWATPAVAGIAAASLLYACTLTRNLDYLSDGKPDAAASENDGGSTTSTTSSSGQNGDAGPAVGTILTEGQSLPANLVQDATNLFWTTDDNRIMKLAKSAAPGTKATQLAKLDGAVGQITQAVIDQADAGNVYLLLESGAIKQVSKGSGPLTDVTVINAPLEAVAIAVDDTNLFVLASGDANDATNPNATQLFRAPKTLPYTATLICATGNTPTAMLLTSDSVFFAAENENSDFVVYQLPKTAGANAAPTGTYTSTLQDQGAAIGIAPTEPYELAIDAQTFFWIDDSENVAYFESLSTPNGKATKLYAPKSTNDMVYALAEDGTNVYLSIATDADSATLLRVPKGGGAEPTTFTLAGLNPGEILSDQTSLYITFDGPSTPGTNGGILKLAK